MAVYDNNYIARYLSGDLTAEEEAEFLIRLQSDQKFATEVEEATRAMAILRERLPENPQEAALRSNLKEMNERHFRTSGTRVIPMKRYLTAAVAAAVIILVIVLWPTQNYMEKWGSIAMVTPQERGGKMSHLQKAAVHFNRREYGLALPLLNKAVENDSSSHMALFYRGVAEFHIGDKESARRDLQLVYNGTSIFKYDAAFFMAVGYAADKDTENAMIWLDKIPENSSISEKAKKLRDEL